MIRPTATGSPMWRTTLLAFLALVALGGMLLVLSSGPADADAVTFTVNKTGDAKDRKINGVCDASRKRGRQCTLRAAIQEANATAGDSADTINFNIGGTAGVKTIKPAKPLPTITDPLTIDGYTQRPCSTNPAPCSKSNTLATGNDAVLLIELNGTNAGEFADGLTIETVDSTIKGLVINRFDGDGIALADDSSRNKIEGNFIGTNADGTAALGNGIGVSLNSTRDITIGGTTSEARNVISGSDGIGIDISGGANNKIEGNYIGTDKNGTTDLGNDSDGVFIFAADNNTIGGTTSGARNVISGNGFDGVHIFGSGATGNKVEGNRIGVEADGTGDLGNDSDGVFIFAADDNTIGGTASGAGNLIAHNSQAGVSIVGSTSTGNSVLSNFIHSNGGLGIDLGTSGVTDNDTDDPDTGANNLQNFPVITSAIKSSTPPFNTSITGTLNSDPSQTFTIQCFLTDTTSATSHGEGLLLLGTTTATTDSGGDGNFACPLTPIPQPGHTVSATATRLDTSTTPATPIETSEFSENELVVQQ